MAKRYVARHAAWHGAVIDHFVPQVNTHQYSATHFERDLDKGAQENSPEGLHIAHGSTGIPGAFFNYEISPILIRHSETRQSFAHFLTSYVLLHSRSTFLYESLTCRGI